MKARKGFTLVELVVVIMILGILAAVAAPKLLGTTNTARENGLRQTLSVVRDAIERYTAENEGFPPGTDLAAELQLYLRGPFPTCPVGNTNSDIAAAATSTPGGLQGWRYNTSTGEFIVNDAGYSTY